MTEIALARVERLELAFVPRPWPFAIERRAEIEAHFADMQRANPALWNGRVLMLHEHTLRGPVFHGAYLETDFATLLAWRHWDYPDVRMKNCFAMGALRGSDGAFLLGVMSSHTANPGRIYFPAGLPDPSDIDGMRRVDLASNVMREIAEETGLAPSELEAEAGWVAVFAGPRIALIKTLDARADAAAMRDRILGHLGSETQPELTDVRIVRGPSDLDPMMPQFVTAYLEHVWNTTRA